MIKYYLSKWVVFVILILKFNTITVKPCCWFCLFWFFSSRDVTWLLHALTAWVLEFRVCLGYTFTPATLPKLKLWQNWQLMIWSLDWQKTQKLTVLCYEVLIVLLIIQKPLHVLTWSNFRRKIWSFSYL
jgi:hypothetical protein